MTWRGSRTCRLICAARKKQACRDTVDTAAITCPPPPKKKKKTLSPGTPSNSCRRPLQEQKSIKIGVRYTAIYEPRSHYKGPPGGIWRLNLNPAVCLKLVVSPKGWFPSVSPLTETCLLRSYSHSHRLQSTIITVNILRAPASSIIFFETPPYLGVLCLGVPLPFLCRL